MEFNKPVSNPMMVGSIELLKAEDTPEHRQMFLDELQKAKFLSPVVIDPVPVPDENGRVTIARDAKVQFPMLSTEDGRKFFMAFTDWTELKRWRDEENQQTFAMNFDDYAGMYTVKLQDQVIDFEKIDEACHYVPSGMNVWEGRRERFDLTQLKCYRSLRDAKRLERSLGTLGGGNHFIEVDQAKDGTYYLVIHSGSRNLGKQVAEFYQQLAIDLHAGKEEYFIKRDEIIRTYKEQGRRAEIQEALKQLKQDYETQDLDVPEDICWLYGPFMDDYLHDIEICQRFARRSRERMAEIIIERTKMTQAEAFHTIHNYIDVDEMILRKGAIAAHAGEKVLIPINMRDGSILAVGKGNVEWNNSAPHGAGRIMSRTKAKQSIDLEKYKASMQGIYSTSVNADTLDEAPMAYKSLADIIDEIRDSVDIIDIMKPVYNFKASDGEVPWKKKGDTNERKDTGSTS